MRGLMTGLIAGLFALVIGAAGMWYFIGAREPAPRVGNDDDVADGPLDDAQPLHRDTQNSSSTPSTNDGVQELLDQANEEITRLKNEQKTLSEDKHGLEAERADLQGEIVRLETRVAELEKLAAGPNNLRIAFGKWGEIRELRATEWKEVGDAVQNMTPHLKELTKSILESRDTAPETMEKIQAQNRRIIAEYGKIMGKLPTNSGHNGEFTHPVYFMNMLAAQLEAAENPLAEEQLSQLAKHGEEYDKRWAKLQEGYDEKTWFIVKILDEAELKEWFIARMFEVTTPEQEAIARPPEVKGYLGLDLYSSGLMLSGHVVPVVRASQPEIVESVKDLLTAQVGLTREQLDTDDYVFSDWINTLANQLQVRPAAQTQIYQTKEVLASGRAQLTAMKALEATYAFTDEERAKYRAVQRIALPLVRQAE
ncbi:MAG: hypothetical protein K8I27_15215 [Planctomycetes bacterium]|nr:hypothetical protein [Planctomycetota bacterium]